MEQPGDLEALQVHADELIAHGDPRGELIALQVAGLEERARELLARHEDDWIGGPRPDGLELRWRFGFVDEVCVRGLPALNALARLLDEPAGRLVASIVLTGECAEDADELVRLVASRGAPALRSLAIRRDGEGRPSKLGHDLDAVGFWRACPRLERLDVAAARAMLGTPSARRLRKLALAGVSLAPNRRALTVASLPTLTRLALRFGPHSDGEELDSALAFLQEAPLAITHLALTGANFIDELCRALARSPMAARLVSLDVTSHALTSRGARALKGMPLRRLTVSRETGFGAHSVLAGLGVELVVRDGSPLVPCSHCDYPIWSHHDDEHPGLCCDCFDLSLGRSLARLNEERLRYFRPPIETPWN